MDEQGATNNILLDGGGASGFSHIDVHRGSDHGAWVIILVDLNAPFQNLTWYFMPRNDMDSWFHGHFSIENKRKI